VTFMVVAPELEFCVRSWCSAGGKEGSMRRRLTWYFSHRGI
jgi:hypothetical protein